MRQYMNLVGNLFESRLDEKVPFDLGHNMRHIIDLRDPDGGPGWDGRPQTEFVVLTKDGGVILYRWASGNIPVDYQPEGGPDTEWNKLHSYVNANMDKRLQRSSTDIAIYRNGFKLDKSRDSYSWGGIRNRLSTDLAPICQALLDRGLATKETPIWVGNWARKTEGESIGSVGRILSREDQIPSRITLYHGTSTARLPQIMRTGIQPVGVEDRIWNKDGKKSTPEHRADCVYLSSDMSRATYYAEKATATDQRRVNRYRGTTDQIRQMQQDVGDAKVEPVILQVILGAADMRKLLADDDFLRYMRDEGKPAEVSDWQQSLNHHGQVAYRGVIPASRLRIKR